MYGKTNVTRCFCARIPMSTSNIRHQKLRRSCQLRFRHLDQMGPKHRRWKHLSASRNAHERVTSNFNDVAIAEMILHQALTQKIAQFEAMMLSQKFTFLVITIKQRKFDSLIPQNRFFAGRKAQENIFGLLIQNLVEQRCGAEEV